jgi:hypothetical protein
VWFFFNIGTNLLERVIARVGKAVAKCVKKWEACFN